jgi:hypothetical protein
LAGWPAVTVAAVGVTVMAKFDPTPASATDWGLPPPSSVMVMAPVLLPPEVGVKVTLIVQFAPAAREFPQVSVWPKSPLAEMEVIFRLAVPPLLSMMVCALLVVVSACPEKVRLLSLRHTADAVKLGSLVTNASKLPPVVAWKGVCKGKSLDEVRPVT